MDNNPKKESGKNLVAPKVNNDQLGENASDEYARKYVNKSNETPGSIAKSKDK